MIVNQWVPAAHRGDAIGDSALRLAHFFGTSAEFWLNLQKLYELRLAEQKAGAVIRGLPRLANRPEPESRRRLRRAA